MSVSVANTDSNLSGQTIVLAGKDQTITGLQTFSRSTAAPFACVSGAAKVANLDADKLDGQDGPSSAIVGISDSQTLTNKTLTAPVLTTPVLGTPASGNLAACTGYPGSSIAAGVVPTASLGSGSATSATFLRGDSTWASATPASGIVARAHVTNGGSAALVAGYNVASVTRNSAGNVTVTFTASVANANYAAVVTSGTSPGAYFAHYVTTRGTGSLVVVSLNSATAAAADTDFDLIVVI